MPTGVYERTPEHRAKTSKTLTGVPKPPRTPEHCKAMSAAHTDVPLSPEHKAAIKRGQEEVGWYESMRGGDDICDHHYIYDHFDLSKYTMKVTRAKHQQIHMWMRKSGIKVPHINMEK